MRISSTLLLTAALVALVAVPAFAKGKANKPDPKAYVWERSIDAGLVFTDGNSSTLDLNYGFDFGIKNDVNAARWTLSSVYTEDRDEDKTENEQLESALKLEHFFTERQSGVLNFSYFRDEIAKVDYSFILSPAYSIYLLKDPDVLELSAEVGPAAVWRSENASPTTMSPSAPPSASSGPSPRPPASSRPSNTSPSWAMPKAPSSTPTSP